jgi:outer membrane protein assembly factor BamB/tetratricopeptide (TPR) repeat protein
MPDESEPILAQVTETKKFSTTDKLYSMDTTDNNEAIIVCGATQDGKGILYAVSQLGDLLWNQPLPAAALCCAVAGQNTFIACAAMDNNLYFFSKHGELQWTNVCRVPPKKLVMSADGNQMVAIFDDGNLLFFDNTLAADRKFSWKHRFDKPPTAVSISGSGMSIAAGTEEGEICKYTERGDQSWTKVLDGAITDIKVAHGGDFVVVGTENNKVVFYSSEAGQTLWSQAIGGYVTSVDVSSSGKLVVACSKDEHVYCYNQSGNLLWKYHTGAPCEKISISRNGGLIVVSVIDTSVHCLSPKGDLLWKFKAWSPIFDIGTAGNSEQVVIGCEGTILFLDNLQVVGGMLPKSQHLMSLAKTRGMSTFKGEKLYEEAMVALNYGDFITAAGKVREIDSIYGIADKKTPARPGKPAPVAGDEKGAILAEIGSVMVVAHELGETGEDVEPIVNLLSEAEGLLEDGSVSDAQEFVNDAKEMLAGLGVSDVRPAAPDQVPALKTIISATDTLMDLKAANVELGDAEKRLSVAKELYAEKAFARAHENANKAVSAMQAAVEPLIQTILINIQKMLALAESRGVNTTEAKDLLMKTNKAFSTGNLVSALDLAKECEEWLEVAVGTPEIKPPEEEVPEEKPLEEEPLVEEPPEEKPPEEKPGIERIEPLKIPEIPSLEKIEPVKIPKIPKEKPPVEEPQIEEPPVEEPPVEEPPVEEPPVEEPPVEEPPVEEPPVEEPPVEEPPVEEPPDEEPPDEEPPDEEPPEEKPVPAEGDPVTAGILNAEKALKEGNYALAVGAYVNAMETIEKGARNAIEKAIAEAEGKIAKAKDSGFDISKAEGKVEEAKKKMDSGEYPAAATSAQEALELVDLGQIEEVKKVLEETRKAIDIATKLGAEITTAQDMLKQADESLVKGNFNGALELADKVIVEVEAINNDLVVNMLTEGQKLVNEAKKMGADSSEAENLFNQVNEALNSKEFAKAHELANKAVDVAKKIPHKFVTKLLNEARDSVLKVEKLGADSMLAKNFYMRARAALAAGDFEGSMKSIEKCQEEVKKAPQQILIKRIQSARGDLDSVKAMGQTPTDVEEMLGKAEEENKAGNFDEALKLVDESLSKLQEIKQLANEATNAIFDTDMALSAAREAGKDVTKANELLNQAMTVRAENPGKARELALEAKKLLEE